MADELALSSLSKAIADIESGGHTDPYKAVGPQTQAGDRAYGKYQIMGNNIPSWTEEAGLGRMSPMQFMSNPDAQEKTFRTRMGKYLDDHGGSVKDAASLWHAGVPYDRAVNEGRRDIAGTATKDYADHVALSVGDLGDYGGLPTRGASAPPLVDPQKVFADPKFWQLGRDDRVGVMAKIDPRFAALSPDDQSSVMQRFQPPGFAEPTPPVPSSRGPIDTMMKGTGEAIEGHEKSLDEAGRAVNRALGMPEDHWSGQWTARLGKNATDAIGDFFEGAQKITHPDGVMDALSSLGKIAHPLAVPGETATDMLWKAANDSGFAAAHPNLAALATVLGGLYVGGKVPLPGVGAAEEMPLQGSRALRAGAEEATAAAEQATSKATAARGASEATTARAETVAAEAPAGPTAEATTRAREALTPSGTPAAEANVGIRSALGERLATLREQTGTIYDTAVQNAEASGRALDPSEYMNLSQNLKLVREKLGTLPDSVETPVANLENKINAGQRVTAQDLNGYKAALDQAFPGKMKAGVEVRRLMRTLFEGDDLEWVQTADNLWRDQLAGRGLSATSLASIVKVAKKSDPTAIVEKLLGNGTSDAQAAMARAIKTHVPEKAEAVSEAFFSRLIKPDAEGKLDPSDLLTSYDKLNPEFRTAISNPGAEKFFAVERETQQGAARAAGEAKTAAQQAKQAEKVAAGAQAQAATATEAAKAPNKMATMGAYGLKIAGAGLLEKTGEALGMPMAGGAAGLAELLIPTKDIAKFLANSKTANLLARMLKTPANSAVVPTLFQQLKDSELAQDLFKTPEGKQKVSEARQQVAGARQDGGPVEADKPYLVGEQGPEVVVPKTSGNVLPNDPSQYRADGSLKGPGFLGTLQRPDGKVSTELSVGVNIGGKETEIPTLVPTLTKDEVQYLVNGGKPTAAIVDKAVAHAKQRMTQGMSPFKGAEEGGANAAP